MQPVACDAPANTRENTKTDGRNRKAKKKKNTDCVQAGRAANPATSA